MRPSPAHLRARPTSARPSSRTCSRRRGVGPGDHVALYLYNGVEYLEGMLAAFKLGAVPINVNYRYVEDELRYLLDDADARAVDLPPRVRAEARRVRATPCLHSARSSSSTTARDADAERRSRRDRVRSRARVAPTERDVRRAVRRRRSTSSTPAVPPGMPKGVMWRHEDVFFGAMGGAGGGGAPITTPGGDRGALPRAAHAGASRRARSCTAPRTGWRSARCSAAAA